MPNETSIQREKKEKQRRKTTSERQKRLDNLKMPLGQENFILLGIGCVALMIGYGLMVWDNDVDGIFSRTLSPVIIIASFVWFFYAILHQSKTPE